MKKAIRVAVILSCMLFFIAPASADVCDDINDVANAWSAVANLVAEAGDAELSDEDGKALEQAVTDLSEGTLALAGALKQSDDAAEAAAGKALEAKFNALQGANGSAATVAALDALVASIDNVTNLCDASAD